MLVWLYIYIVYYIKNIKNSRDRISGVMVSMLASSAIKCGFEPWSSQTKDNKIGICYFSTKRMQH